MKRTFKLLFLALILVLTLNMVGRPFPSAQATGAQWSRTMENVPVRVPAQVYAVWGSSARDVYAVGETVGAPLLFHNDGSGWSNASPALPAGWRAIHLLGIWGFSARDVYAVGVGFNTAWNQVPLLYHNDGTGWTTDGLSLPAGWDYGHLLSMWGSSASDVYTVGWAYNAVGHRMPLLYHSDGTGWTEAALSLPVGWLDGQLFGVWGSSANNIYAVGQGVDEFGQAFPLFYHNDGSSWRAASSSLPDGWDLFSPLYGVWGIWGSSANDVYVVGSAIDAAGNQVPLLYHNDGSGWREASPSLPAEWSSAYLRSVWGSSAEDIYAVGWASDVAANQVPLLYHNDGTGWTEAALSLPDGWSIGDLRSVWGSSASDIYAVGSSDQGPLFYHNNGTGWTETAAPAIIYVDHNATGANNGISWANAYTDLQSALATASDGDEIWVAAGTYKPTSGTDRAISFTLKNGVAMYGGFAGAETSRAERDVNINVTVLSGDVGVVGNNSDNSYHVVVGSNTNNSAVLDGFTIMAGKTRDGFGTSAEYMGGGIYTDSGNPVLSNLIIRENSARIGNGIYNYKSSPILVNVAFIDNTWFAGSVAGAMVNEDDSSPTLTNVMFINNSGWQGGALFNVRRSNPTLLNVIFAGNSTSDRGGAIYNSSSNPILTNVTFRENSATQGGAIFNDGDSNPTLVNVTFTGNSASDRGGAIYNYYSNPTLNSVTFHENSAIQGGAIFNDYSWHSIIMNSILYGDTGGEIYNYSTPATVNYSIVQGGYLGTGNIDIDPLLGPLQDNGGFTQTMALLPGSPAIDAGDDVNCPSTDQRGVTRPQGSHCDIGAYEYEPESTIHHVKWNATGTNNGTSWANAYTDLQSALAVASSSDEIWVATGTYKPTAGTDRNATFALISGVEIYGGFAGIETVVSQRNPAANLTILSGDIGILNDISDNSFNVVTGENLDSTTVLDGFTIAHGNANAFSTPCVISTCMGGGLYNDNSSLTLSNLVFSNNSASYDGGGIYNHGTYNERSNPALTNVTFSGNSADYGGGMGNYTSNPVLTNVTFSDNSADYGAGMYNLLSDPILTRVTFSNNSGGQSGGGMSNHDSSLTLTDVTFSGNSADYGGGIYNSGISDERYNLTLTNVTFRSNSAKHGGGIYNDYYSNPTLTNVTFNDNSASVSGGGMENFYHSSPTLTNVTFSHNLAAVSGGGMYNANNYSYPHLTNVTFSGNEASIGGGIYNDAYGNSIINNSIFYGNLGGEIDNYSGTATVTYSIVQGGYPGTGNLDIDPLLGSLKDNGGFTQTMALGAGSAAIDAANDSNCPSTDQRGVTRPQGIHCDIGAYEAEGIKVTINGTEMGSYFLTPNESVRKSYIDVNNGPVKIINTDHGPIIGAERVIYNVNGTPTSFSEMMALPDGQLDKTYWMPWYNNVDLDTQLRFGNVSDTPATVHVWIGGHEKTTGCTSTPANVPYPYVLAAGASMRVSCPGVNEGPVKIISNVNIVAAERVIYNVNGLPTSFTEMMGLPASQLDTTYWMPWYNNVDLDTQLRFGNVSNTPATVQVWIGGHEKTTGCTTTPANVPYPYVLAAGASLRVSCPNVNSGPVQIVSNVNIVAAERVIYNVNGLPTSFSEMMGLPDNQLNNTYWMPWYNNVDLDTQLRFGNVSDSPATVRVFIGEQETTNGCTTTPANIPYPYVLAVGASLRVSCPNVNNGPVQIVSDVNIVAAERVIYNVNGLPTSFSEMMGLPASQLDKIYWLPWYNNIDLDTQLRFGVP